MRFNCSAFPFGIVTEEPDSTVFAPRPGPGPYERVTLRRDAQMEVARVHWPAGAEGRLHGHGRSAAVYTVVSGCVEEERYLPEGDGFRHETVLLRAGDCTRLPAGSYHRLRARTDSVSVHVYTPPSDNTVTEVPADVMARLEAARRRPADLLAVVSRYVDGWAQREASANREGALHMPAATLDEFRASGLLAAPVPAALGGWGTSLAQAAEAVRRVARRAPATALALVMPLGNAATTRIPAAAVDPAQRAALAEGQRWIAEQVRHGRILAVANSEPGAGGELANTKTRAERGADGAYRLTGRKSFATFGRDADYFLCAARRKDGGAGRDVVDGFFVARHAPGLVVDDRWDPVGMRPTASVGLVLDAAPAEAVLGYPGCLEGVNARHWSTALFAAIFLGVGEGALREGAAHTSADAVWARGALAEHALALDAAAAFVEAVAGDERWPLPAEAQERARRAKTYVAQAAVKAATQVAMVSGGRCYTPQHPVFRFLCDALAGPLLRPPLPQAMDAVVRQLFATAPAETRAAA
jgi:alkylation response protein AidB-like acyl-CoA dehydrogenase/mannose-6-phosphate isomerase-like protein (cupin superfamily)